MKKTVIATLILVSAVFTFMGCKSWAPSTTEQGKCSVDRQWVPPQQDADGNWKEGYCEWLPGKAG